MDNDILYKKQEIYRTAQRTIAQDVDAAFADVMPLRIQLSKLLSLKSCRIPYQDSMPSAVVKKMIFYQKKLQNNPDQRPDNDDSAEVCYIKYESAIDAYVYVCSNGTRYSVAGVAINDFDESFSRKKLIYTAADAKDIFLPSVFDDPDYQKISRELNVTIITPSVLPRNALLAMGIYQRDLQNGDCTTYDVDDIGYLAARRLIMTDYGQYKYLLYMLDGSVYLDDDSDAIYKKLISKYGAKTPYKSAAQIAQAAQKAKEDAAAEKDNNKSQKREKYPKKKNYNADHGDDDDNYVEQQSKPKPSRFSIFNQKKDDDDIV
jgi:hypothetical protein